MASSGDGDGSWQPGQQGHWQQQQGNQQQEGHQQQGQPQQDWQQQRQPQQDWQQQGQPQQDWQQQGQPQQDWQQQGQPQQDWQQQQQQDWQQQQQQPQQDWQQQQQQDWQQQQQQPQQDWQQPSPQQGHWQQQPPPQQGHWQPQPPPAPPPQQQGHQQPPLHGQLPQAQVGAVTAPSANPLALAFKRAFRLQISPEEVTPGERTKLESAGVRDPYLQGFLAWRRSLLFLVALLLAPVAVLKIVDYGKQSEGMPDTLSGLMAIEMLVNVGFAAAIWVVLPMWTRWRAQRRFLVGLWLVYFITPFLMFLYPWREALGGGNKQAAMLFGALVSLGAVMSLAPKAISLMPGLVRASIAVKMLLPGSSAPGWLIVLVAPIYAIFFYVILVLPYQMSGSGFFVGAMLGFTGAQLWIARMGLKLARPESREETAAIIGRVRVGFHVLNGIGAVMLIAALADFVGKLDISAISVIEMGVAFVANVLLLTAITTDLLLTNLHRAHAITSDPSTHEAQRAYAEAIGHFANPQAPGASSAGGGEPAAPER